MQITPDTTIGELEIAMDKPLADVLWDAGLAEGARLVVGAVGIDEERIKDIVHNLANSSIGNTELGFYLATCLSAIDALYSKQ